MQNLVGRDGDVFADTHTIREKLGDGGTAQVWAALHEPTGEVVACKMASKQPGMRWSRAVRTFEHERLMLERCVSDHVLGVRGLYQGVRDLALILELVPGGDVQQLLQRHGALAETAACCITRQLSAALAHCHSVGVLHRDVKLENILVVKAGSSPTIKLCDFGHASWMHDKDDGFTGTTGYAAPEVAGEGGRVPEWSAAADVWSTGVVMYSMLANAQLSFLSSGPDFHSHRAMRVLSDKVKQLIRAMLTPRRDARCTLQHVMQISDEQWKSPIGLRRTLGGKSYSLLDLQSLDGGADGQRGGVPRLSAGPLAASTTPSVSASTSRQDLDEERSLPRTGSSLNNLLQEAGGSDSFKAALPSTPEPADEAPSNESLPPQESLPPSARAAAGGVAVSRVSWWRGTYARQLQLDDEARCLRTIEPSTGRVTNMWRFDQVLAVLEDADAPAAADAPIDAPAAPPSTPSHGGGGGVLSLLLEGGTMPLLSCFSAFMVQRVRFCVPPEERTALVTRLRAAIAGSIPVPTMERAQAVPAIEAPASPASPAHAAARPPPGYAASLSPSSLSYPPPFVQSTPTAHQVIHPSPRLAGRRAVGSPGGSPLAQRTSGAAGVALSSSPSFDGVSSAGGVELAAATSARRASMPAASGAPGTREGPVPPSVVVDTGRASPGSRSFDGRLGGGGGGGGGGSADLPSWDTPVLSPLLQQTFSAGGVAPDASRSSLRDRSRSVGMSASHSAGSLETLDRPDPTPSSASKAIKSPSEKEEQLRRMRERLAALRTSGAAPVASVSS